MKNIHRKKICFSEFSLIIYGVLRKKLLSTCPLSPFGPSTFTLWTVHFHPLDRPLSPFAKGLWTVHFPPFGPSTFPPTQKCLIMIQKHFDIQFSTINRMRKKSVLSSRYIFVFSIEHENTKYFAKTKGQP